MAFDMQSFSPVKTWHNDVYDAISPYRPGLNARGKTVVITGAGSGVGQETAIAFAKASAQRLVLIGRTQTTLEETKEKVSEIEKTDERSVPTTCSIHVANITDRAALEKAASNTGTWDILILNAGVMVEPKPITEGNLDDEWKVYEVDVRGTLLTLKTFLPTARKDHATVLGLTSASIILPPAVLLGNFAYVSAKLAMVKILEYLAAENPSLFVANVHPGVIETKLSMSAPENHENKGITMDTARLPAHFMVWLSSPEGAFLRGKLVFANWDVTELKSLAWKLKDNTILSIGKDCIAG